MKWAGITLILAAFLLVATGGSWASEAATLSIYDTKVEHIGAGSESKMVISCSVHHAMGDAHIERVAATIYHGRFITTYPTLYDDGTHGDKVGNDGVYSLEIAEPKTEPSQEIKIIFTALDKDRREIESEPLVLNSP